jgi:hypothetical protein
VPVQTEVGARVSERRHLLRNDAEQCRTMPNDTLNFPAREASAARAAPIYGPCRTAEIRGLTGQNPRPDSPGAEKQPATYTQALNKSMCHN